MKKVVGKQSCVLFAMRLFGVTLLGTVQCFVRHLLISFCNFWIWSPME